MKGRLLESWIDGYLTFTENSEPPRSFRLWSAIAVIASCLQRKCYLPWGTLIFYPNLYTVLVGPPAARKGTAMNQAFRFLENLNIKMAAEATTRESLIRELKETTDGDLDQSTGKMTYHSSLTIWAQELTVFLGYNNLQLLSDLTDWYDCRNKWTYRTKTQGTDEINSVYVNLFGATTPDLIRSTMPLNAIGGGLTSRMIFVFEWDKGKVVPYTGLTLEEKELGMKLERDLEKIRMLAGEFKTTPSFMDKWVEWYSSHEDNLPFRDQKFDGYFQRRGNHIMKLAMIVNAARTSSMIIDAPDLNKAIDILTLTEVNMPHTFSGVGRASHAEVMSRMIIDIARAGDEGVFYSELLRNHRNDADSWTLDKIIQTLEMSKIIKPKVIDPGVGDVRIIYRPQNER